MGEVKYFDFPARRPLSREEWLARGFNRAGLGTNVEPLFSSRRPHTPPSSWDVSRSAIATPERPTRQELIQRAADSIVAVSVFDAELQAGAEYTGEELDQLRGEQDEALSVLSVSEQSQAWDLVEELIPAP